MAGNCAPAPWLAGLTVTVGEAAAQTVETSKVAVSVVRLTWRTVTPVAASLKDCPSPSDVTKRVLPLFGRTFTT